MTARNERLREKQRALGLEPVQTVLHPDDKAALLEFAHQLRVQRGTLTPSDTKRVNEAAATTLFSIRDERIERVATVVRDFEAIKKTETSPRWEKAVQFIKAVKDALKNA